MARATETMLQNVGLGTNSLNKGKKHPTKKKLGRETQLKKERNYLSKGEQGGGKVCGQGSKREQQGQGVARKSFRGGKKRTLGGGTYIQRKTPGGWAVQKWGKMGKRVQVGDLGCKRNCQGGGSHDWGNTKTHRAAEWGDKQKKKGKSQIGGHGRSQKEKKNFEKKHGQAKCKRKTGGGVGGCGLWLSQKKPRGNGGETKKMQTSEGCVSCLGGQNGRGGGTITRPH